MSSRPALLYAAAAAALITLWYAPYVLSSQVGILDWAKDGYALSYLKASLGDFHAPPKSFIALPQEIAWYPTLAHSASYWGNPEVLTLSPLMLPLFWLPVGAFFKLYFLVHVLVGAVGIHLLARRLGLGVGAALAALVLIGLNPWLLQHVAIGYTPWVTAAYAPLLVALLVTPRIRLWELALGSALNALILYEGGLHVFVWLNGAIATVLAVRLARTRRPAILRDVALMLAGTAILVAPKLLAGSEVYGDYRGSMNPTYGSLSDLWGLLTDAPTPLYDPQSPNRYGTAFYDGSTYMGKAFLVVLALGLGHLAYRAMAARGSLEDGGRPLAVDALAAAGVWLLLGWSGVWKAVTDAIPALVVERYPYRFLFIAVVLLCFVLVVEVDAFARGAMWRKLVAGVAIAIVAVGLWQRNSDLSDVAASGGVPLEDRAETMLGSLGASAKESGAPMPIAVSSAGIVVKPAGAPLPECVRLPWLAPGHVKDFSARNARLVPDPAARAVDACPVERDAEVRLDARSYGRNALLAACALLYGAFLLGVVRLERRRQPSNASRTTAIAGLRA